ncbi:RICIN domain-containing protein [Actinoplanes sp. NBC_00393]|uniref:ricin-type beta-trefoil lectin domain protein n=1 Tax=Actinoplanes sp. NBC_00393 TaxID=2975953 RepID=UPI002E21CD3E
MAMMIITVGVVLSVALLPVIVRQVTTTRSFIDRNAALSGAQIGMDVVLARIAAAADTDDESKGLLEDLPRDCVFTGDAGVAGTGEKLSYEVTIHYYDENNVELPCPLTKAPRSAKIESKGYGTLNQAATGSDATYGSRTLAGTYTFTLDNTNIDGGAIRVSSSTVGNLCMDAGSTTPAAGTAVKMKLCDGSSTQQFQYTKELYLHLVNSETDANPNGMCLHSGATHSSGNAVVLQPCPTGTAIVTQYQWSLDGNSAMHSTSPTQSVESLCISLKNANKVDSTLQLGGCGANGSTNVWRFDAGVGAGMAGEETYQLVNYSQFSRCLDVTNKSVGYAYMIAWFCKQDPKGVVEWNQIWVHPIPVAPATQKLGAIVVTNSGTKYCLKSPLKATTDSWVTTEKCPSNYTNVDALKVSNPNLVWNVRHNTGSYTTSYRIEDTKGFCLQPTDLTNAPKETLHSDGTSRVKVAVCNSSELQKWNAPANLTRRTPLSDVKEK